LWENHGPTHHYPGTESVPLLWRENAMKWPEWTCQSRRFASYDEARMWAMQHVTERAAIMCKPDAYTAAYVIEWVTPCL